MKQVNFKHANRTYCDSAGNVASVYHDTGLTVSCHKATFWERIRVLFTGRVFVCTVGSSPAASRVMVNENELFGEV